MRFEYRRRRTIPPFFRLLPPGTTGRMKRYGLEWWHPPIYLLLALQAVLYVTTQRRPGIAGVICWIFGSDFALWAGIAVFWTLIGLVVANFRRPFATRWRAAALAGLGLLGLSPTVYRVYPSSHDGRPSAVRFRLPLEGDIRVAWGGGTRPENYHVSSPSQKWAYDLLVTRDGSSHGGEGLELTDYHVYNLPVLAPADGIVVSVHDGDPEMRPGELGGGTTPAGNHVVMRVAEGEYLFLCHFRPGTIGVKKGDQVRAGQEIGRVGDSGNTSEPHLHVHLQDTDHLLVGEGIPMPFYRYRIVPEGRVVERGIPTGGFGPDGFRGQVIEPVPDE